MRIPWFRKCNKEVEEKRADTAIQELKESLIQTLGSGLKSMILFGSRVSGEYRQGQSNVNLCLVVEDIHWDNLRALEAPLKSWTKRGHAMPVLLQSNELAIYARALPVEFLDMRDYHDVLHGADPFETLDIDDSHLRDQIEQELVVKQLKLRQTLALYGDDQKRMRELLTTSFSSLLTLFRAVYRLTTKTGNLRKLDAANRLAEIVPFEPAVLHRIHQQKIRRKEDELGNVARNYLDIIEKVVQFLGKNPGGES